MKRNLPLARFAVLLALACATLRAEERVNLKETVQAYPVVKGMKMLCVKRAMPKLGKKGPSITMLKSLGFPSNHECQSSVKKMNYDNEIGILDLATGKYTTLYRPKGRSFVGNVNLHWNAKKIIFTHSDETNYKIFEINIDGTGLRQVSETPNDVDCFEPCYLPDGRIIVNSNAPYQSVPCWHGYQDKFVANLYVMDADGSNMRRLTFDQDHDFHPFVRHNGQVVYSRWDYTGINRIFLRPVMAMHPDGTSQKAIYGSNSWFPNGLYYPKELPGQIGKFLCVLAGYHGSYRSGTLAVIDINKGTKEDEGFVCQISGTGKPVGPEYRDTLTVKVWPQFVTPTPLTDRVFLTSAWKDIRDRNIGIYLADLDDNVTLLHAEEEFAFLEPIALIQRRQPPAIPDRVNLDSREATAYIQDIYHGPGLKDVPRGTVKNLRVIAYDFGYIGLAGNDIIGLSGPWEAMRILGTVPVEEDGSATFRVPANTPIAFQALDAEGKAVQLMRSWVTPTPGETMSCVGCHESSHDTPLSHQTIASGKPPRELDPWYGPSRGFDFAREVQPVLNRYCVSCHDQQNKLDLRSEEHFPDYAGRLPGRLNYQRMHDLHKKEFDNKVLYTPAYEALVPYIRRVNVGDDVSLLEPGEYHADTSLLIQILKAGHEGVQMDEESWSRLITWIDLNGPCHGTWPDVYNMPIPDEHNHRRWELATLYGAPAVNPEVIPKTPKYDETPVEFKTPPEKEKAKIKPLSEPPTLQHRTMDLGGGQSIELVRFGRPYWMGTCEISNAQFQRFDPDHFSRYYVKRHETRGDDRGMPLDLPDQPALRVSWNRAMAFCDWLSEKTGMDVTLPTEEQWGTACRAGSDEPFHYRGEDFSQWGNMADKTFATVGYRNRITEQYLINSKTGGSDFLRLDGEGEFPSPWVRATCGLGVLPANGLLYSSPYSCTCVSGTMLAAFNALYEEGRSAGKTVDLSPRTRLIKGPAFGTAGEDEAEPTRDDWPTYRNTSARSGVTRLAYEGKLQPAWQARLPSSPTAPIIVGDRVFLAAKDRHTLYALSRASGKTAWSFVANGRIDSPPTYYKGLLLFGCRGGWVYALRARDGALAWKFNDLPEKRLISARGQLESAWPVSGSVMVHEGVVYFAAGRQTFIDGGTVVYGLHPLTGEVLYRRQVSGPYDKQEFPRIRQLAGIPQIEGFKSGIFSAENGLLYLRHQAFRPDLTPVAMEDIKDDHLIASAGFLDGTPQHRTYWSIDTDLRYGPANAFISPGPQGDIVAVDGNTFYEIRGYLPGRHGKLLPANGYTLYSGTRSATAWRPPRKGKPIQLGTVVPLSRNWEQRWSTQIPLSGHALIVAGNTVVAAGVPMEASFGDGELSSSFAGDKGGRIWAARKMDGGKIASRDLPSPPVWDGLAAARGDCIIALKDGTALCLR